MPRRQHAAGGCCTLWVTFREFSGSHSFIQHSFFLYQLRTFGPLSPWLHAVDQSELRTPEAERELGTPNLQCEPGAWDSEHEWGPLIWGVSWGSWLEFYRLGARPQYWNTSRSPQCSSSWRFSKPAMTCLWGQLHLKWSFSELGQQWTGTSLTSECLLCVRPWALAVQSLQSNSGKLIQLFIHPSESDNLVSDDRP